jgi:hypothetical protein
VRESGKPCRILYVSDFDPGGQSMPVAAARKIEFLARKDDLDIQVRTVALTHDQCIEFRLPRTPIKETEVRAARFEERFGEGGTELDALEALHPGALAQILEDEIGRYYDRGLNSHINWAANNARAELEIFNLEVQRRYQNEIDALEAEVDELNADIEAFIEELREREEDIANRAQPLYNQIRRELVNGMPSTFEWPEPAEGDEDADPPSTARDPTSTKSIAIAGSRASRNRPTIKPSVAPIATSPSQPGGGRRA